MKRGDAQRIERLIAPYRVAPGRRIRLPADFDPADTHELVRKEDAKDLLAAGVRLLSEHQERLAAQDRWSLLVILQAMDAAGKDGTIRHVMSGVNPQGVEVTSYKAPSAAELDHDYLWRTTVRLPSRGTIGIFNRSYYEEVLVVRVHPELLGAQRLPPGTTGPGIWKRRYREIGDFERRLHDNGTRIVKLFLNVSKDEQRRRFLERIEDPTKHWKFSAADIRERRHWDAYQAAYADAISATSTADAPWYVIPADHKWFARLVAAAAIVDALRRIDPRFPEVSPEARAAQLAARDELLAEG
ncbi:MAG: polyphosphate kinase 2 family protein [Chloroflexota bacterium]